MFTATLLLCFFYLLLIIIFRYGWSRLQEYTPAILKRKGVSISIIIPARNEAENLPGLFNALLRQEYSRADFEVILVDDHSTDDTLQLARKLAGGAGIKFRAISLEEPDKPGFYAYKKRAIEAGIEEAGGDYILTTDADCLMGGNWLAMFATFIDDKAPELVAGPVAFEDEDTLLHKLQSLEFMGLIGIGAASIRNKMPNMCNGANLLFRTKTFYEVGGYSGIDHIASGDDELLMHRIFEIYPEKVHFLKNRDAVVYTDPVDHLDELLRQRKRWVSKSRKYTRRWVTATLVLAYLFHLVILVNFTLGFDRSVFWLYAFMAFAVKVVAEIIFLLPVTRFFRKQKLMVYYIPASIIYVFYVLFIGIYGNSGSYTWKNREVR